MGVATIAIGRSGIDECYQTGLVKPNEFRQICVNHIEKEIALTLENMTLRDKLEMFKCWCLGEDWLLNHFQELSDSKESLFDCIIGIAGSDSSLLHITEEEAKLLFLSNLFNKKALLVRDCSDLLNNPLATSDQIFVDKETLRAIEYICKYVNGGKAVLKTLTEEEE